MAMNADATDRYAPAKDPPLDKRTTTELSHNTVDVVTVFLVKNSST